MASLSMVLFWMRLHHLLTCLPSLPGSVHDQSRHKTPRVWRIESVLPVHRVYILDWHWFCVQEQDPLPASAIVLGLWIDIMDEATRSYRSCLRRHFIKGMRVIYRSFPPPTPPKKPTPISFIQFILQKVHILKGGNDSVQFGLILTTSASRKAAVP